jgi:signal transduction histidine kinase
MGVPKPTEVNLINDPRGLSFARKAMIGASLLGGISCLYAAVLVAPTGKLSSLEMITLPIMSLFSLLMIIILTKNNPKQVSWTAIAFSIWIGVHVCTNLAFELFNRPDFGNALIYLIWVPAAYLFATAVTSLKIAMRISCSILGAIVAILVIFLVTHTPPSPGESQVFDALMVGAIAQAAMLAVIFGVARYREYYVREHATLEQWAQNAVALEAAAKVARQGREAAELANKTKSQFLTNVTHELRTPLNGIMGLAEILSVKEAGGSFSKKDGQYLEAIQNSGVTLLNLIDDILNLSVMDSDDFVLNESRTDIEACLRNCASLFQGRREAQGHDLEIDIDAGLPHLLADETLLTQMSLSLLSNAGKFSPAPSVITLAAGLNGQEKLEITITDQGIGIPDHCLDALGSAFFQVDATCSRATSGLGLGLALTKARIEVHGGTLEFQENTGGGTTATLTFPASRNVLDEHALKVS